MTGCSEETAADQPGPKAIAAREELRRPGKAEIEHLEFMRSVGHGGDMRPTTGDLLQNNPKAEDRACDIKEHLDCVGPDHRRHSALEGVKQRQTNDYDDRDDLASA